jgi:hypothetical protein
MWQFIISFVQHCSRDLRSERSIRFSRGTIAVCAGLAFGTAARAEGLQDALFSACIANGTYRGLSVSESETCQCWANIVSQHLTPDAAKQITDPPGEGIVLDKDAYVGGLGPVSTALLDNCPGVQAKLDRMNTPTDVPPCKEAFKTHREDLTIEWACKADAERGDAEAQYYMGWAVNALDGSSFYDGARPPGPRIDALEWIRRSANQGYDRAQFALGQRYAQGDGVAKDEAEAAKWYTLAADQGDKGAQHYLAVLYEYGRGVQKDLVQAYKWYSLAAVDSRDPIPGRNRDSLAQQRRATRRSAAIDRGVEAKVAARRSQSSVPTRSTRLNIVAQHPRVPPALPREDPLAAKRAWPAAGASHSFGALARGRSGRDRANPAQYRQLG